MQNINQFDPTQQSGNMSFVAHLPNGGWLLLINESVIGLQLFLPNTGFKATVPPFCMRMMRLTVPVEQVNWSQAYSLTGSPSPINTVAGEVLEESEWSGEEFLIPLPRFVNIGNGVLPTTSSSSLVNDGNAAGSAFIEATATGAPSSNVKILNDGTLIFSVLNNGTYKTVFSITPGTASTPASVTLHGVVDLANQLLAQSSGSAGLILENVAGKQSLALTGYGSDQAFAIHAHSAANGDEEGVVVNADGSVTLAKGGLGISTAGVISPGTIAGSSVTGDLAANQVGPGAMDADVAIGGLLEGQTGQMIGLKPETTETGIFDATNPTILKSGNSLYIGYNNYYDGTNDRFVNASSMAVSIALNVLTVNGLIMPAVRFSTNTPTAGAVITWSSFFQLGMMKSAGGGAAGTSTWEGTTDPTSSAGEGDVWYPK